MNNACKHNAKHHAAVSIGFLEDSGRFTCDVKVNCAECGRPFQFLGLPIGLDLNGGAFINADGQELRVALAPVGTVPQPLDNGLVRGFRIRQPGDH